MQVRTVVNPIYCRFTSRENLTITADNFFSLQTRSITFQKRII